MIFDISTKQIRPFFPMAPLKLPGRSPDPDAFASWCPWIIFAGNGILWWSSCLLTDATSKSPNIDEIPGFVKITTLKLE